MNSAAAVIKIRMLTTIYPNNLPYDVQLICGVADTVLHEKNLYVAIASRNGDVNAICENGKMLKVKFGEFEFVEAPEWLIAMYRYQASVKEFNSVFFPHCSHAQSFVLNLEHAAEKGGDIMKHQLSCIGWSEELKQTLLSALDDYEKHERQRLAELQKAV